MMMMMMMHRTLPQSSKVAGPKKDGRSFSEMCSNLCLGTFPKTGTKTSVWKQWTYFFGAVGILLSWYAKFPAEASFLRWHPARRPKWKVIVVLMAECLIDNWSVKGYRHFGCYCLMEEVVIKPYLKTVILCKSIDADLFPSTVWMFEMCFYLHARLD